MADRAGQQREPVSGLGEVVSDGFGEEEHISTFQPCGTRHGARTIEEQSDGRSVPRAADGS